MEPITVATQDRSASCGGIETEFQQHFGEEELHSLMSVAVPPSDTTGSSFTALLELPPNQAMELLVHSPERAANHAIALSGVPFHPPPQLIFPSDAALIDRASKFSPIVNSEENWRGKNLETVKQEPVESDSNPNSSSSPAVSNPTTDQNPKSTKRKESEKKGKESSKKSKKSANDTSADDAGEKLPYVHVRARRGQATNSHSLAERARREKINARMKLLQELVPGCNKISGTAMVLDEIINHVQALQRQVEFLSMRLAAVNPRSDFNFDTLLAAESGSAVEGNYQDMVMPSIWPEGQVNESRQPYQQQQWQLDGLHAPVWNNRAENNSNFITPENSLLSYNSSANSASLRSDQLKMEL